MTLERQRVAAPRWVAPYRPTGAPADRPRRDKLHLRAAAALAGGLPLLCFPKAGLGVLAWVALVPVLLVIASAPTAREAAVRGWWAGAGFILAVHHWLFPNLGPFLLLVAVAVGVLWLPWGAAAWWLLSRPRSSARSLAALLVLPSGWVLIEAVRSWQSLGGPWGLLGATQWSSPPMLGLARLGGVWLVSFAVVLANTAIVLSLRPGPPRLRAAAALAAGLAVAGGPLADRVHPPAGPDRHLLVALVQPGVIHGPAARFDAGAELTRRLAGRGVDLVVWGESSVGYDLDARPDLRGRLQELSREVGADLLVNVDARAGVGGISKTSVLIGPAGVSGRYEKTRLVPFGEYVPLRPALGWLSGITASATEDRRRGTSPQLLSTAGTTVGPLVCFESAFPDLARTDVRRGAELIVYQSATSTFQGSWAPAQHASLAAVRAAEVGRPVVQAALSGVSAAFDSTGRRLAWVDTSQHGVMVVAVPLARSRTPYVRFGDWVLVAALIVVAAAAAASVRGRVAGCRR